MLSWLLCCHCVDICVTSYAGCTPAARGFTCGEEHSALLCRADAKTLPGVTDPFPNIFDPANLLSNATSIQEVRRWRESEITHGRVAMLASLGFIVGEQVEDSSSPFFPHVEGAVLHRD